MWEERPVVHLGIDSGVHAEVSKVHRYGVLVLGGGSEIRLGTLEAGLEALAPASTLVMYEPLVPTVTCSFTQVVHARGPVQTLCAAISSERISVIHCVLARSDGCGIVDSY